MSQTQTVARPTTGKICMWNGTADGQEDGFVDVSNGKTNALPPKIINVTVQDIRDQDPQPSVNTDGYELLKYPTSIPAEVFENPLTEENKEILVTAYFEECRRLVQEITGAAETFTFIHRIRSQNTDFNNALDFKQDAFKGTVPLAHVDRDPVTAPERLRSSMGDERAEALMKKYKRWAIVNVWRPIGPAVQKWPRKYPPKFHTPIRPFSGIRYFVSGIPQSEDIWLKYPKPWPITNCGCCSGFRQSPCDPGLAL